MSATAAVTTDKDWELLQNIVKSLLEAKALADEAEITYWRKVHEVEKRHLNMILKFHESFEHFLEAYHLGKTPKYRDMGRKIVLADREFGTKTVDALGAMNAVEGVKIADPAKRALFVEAALQKNKTEGVYRSRDGARRLRQTIEGRAPKKSLYNHKAEQERRLYDENVQLKKENAQIRARVKELETEIKSKNKEISRLQKLVDKTQP